MIVGGESGPGARPCDVAWIRDVVRQCREAGTACFVKQLGAVPGYRNSEPFTGWHDLHNNGERLRDPKGGDPAEWSQELRVREFPR